MARQVIKNAYLLLNGQDLSNHIDSITVTWAKTDVEVTAMGDGGKFHLAGLEDNKFSVTFWQDHAATSVGPTLDAIMLAATAVAFKITDQGSGTISATNPSYSGSAVLISYTPVAGQVGAGQQAAAEFSVNGVVVAGTT
jgi:hypothetical protein